MLGMVYGVMVYGVTDSFSFVLNGVPNSLPFGSKVYDTEISWKSDRDKKFKDPGVGATPFSVSGASGLTRNLTSGIAIGLTAGGQMDATHKGIEDEHFIVWTRTAGLPTFKKLWARFPDGFKENDVVTVTISNRMCARRAVFDDWIRSRVLIVSYRIVSSLVFCLICLITRTHRVQHQRI